MEVRLRQTAGGVGPPPRASEETMMHRRHILQGALATLVSGLLPSIPVVAQPRSTRLVLLGTKGGPSVRDLRQMPFSNLLIVGGSNYLVDAGYGTTARLVEKAVPLPSIRAVFITHHHSDHNLELGPALYNAWVNGLERPIDVYGPEGVEQLLRDYLGSNRIDIDIRMADEGRPDLRTLVAPHAYVEGPVMEDA